MNRLQTLNRKILECEHNGTLTDEEYLTYKRVLQGLDLLAGLEEHLDCAALKAFKEKYGRCWKSELSTMWFNGTDWKEPNGHLLRQVRNQLGPSWLVKCRGI